MFEIEPFVVGKLVVASRAIEHREDRAENNECDDNQEAIAIHVHAHFPRLDLP